jgi:hypothetical protein
MPRIPITLGDVIRSSLIRINALASPAAVLDVALSRIEDNTIGIDGGAPKLRVTTVRRNPGDGVILAHAFHDLGTATNRGHNVFRDNGPNGSVRFASGSRGGSRRSATPGTRTSRVPTPRAATEPGFAAVPGSSPLANGTNFRVPFENSSIILL